MSNPKIHNISVTKLVKKCIERAEELPDDLNNETGVPSTKALLIFAAEVMDTLVLGESGNDVVFPLAEIDKDEEESS